MIIRPINKRRNPPRRNRNSSHKKYIKPIPKSEMSEPIILFFIVFKIKVK